MIRPLPTRFVPVLFLWGACGKNFNINLPPTISPSQVQSIAACVVVNGIPREGTTDLKNGFGTWNGIHLSFSDNSSNPLTVYFEARSSDDNGCNVLATAQSPPVTLPYQGPPIQLDFTATDKPCKLSATASQGQGHPARMLFCDPAQPGKCPPGFAQDAHCPPDAVYVAPGQSVLLTATDGGNSHFGGWTAGDDCIGKGRTCPINNIQSSKKIEARFDLGTCANDHLCWENPLPQGNRLYGVWGTPDGSEQWTVGEVGTALRYQPDGWHHVDSGTTSDLYGVSGSEAQDVFVVGDAGAIGHFDGTRLSPVPPVAPQALRGVFAGIAGSVWAVGDGSTIVQGSLIDPQHGWQWAVVPPNDSHDPLPDLRRITSWKQDPDPLFLVAAASDGQIQMGGSKAWGPPRPCAGMPLSGLFHQPGGPLWLVGDTGLIASWDGTQCSILRAAGPPLRGIAATAAGTVLAVGDQGQVLRGPEWAPDPSAAQVQETLYDIWGRDPGTFVAVGDSGVILRRQGDGPLGRETISAAGASALGTVRAIAGADRDQGLWAVGDQGLILHWDGSQPGGMQWTSEGGNLTRNNLLAVTAATGEVWAVGEMGTVLHRDATGAWRAIPGPDQRQLNSVATSATHLWVAGKALSVWRRPLSGQGAWEDAAPQTALRDYYVVWAHDQLVCLGSTPAETGGVNVLCSPAGAPGAWDPQLTQSDSAVYALWGTGPADIWAAGDGIVLHRTQNTDDAWHVQSLPGMSLRAGASVAGQVFVAGLGGTLLRLDTGADGLVPVPSGTRHDLLGIWAGQVDDIVVVGEQGTILRYLP